jgi:metal-responsive CopG/Arc/MetJ family transcriptional regulator
MPPIAIGHTGYTRPVAKVLVSVPDDLLKEIDARAEALRQSRSGYLRQLAEDDLEDHAGRRTEVKRLLGLILANSEGKPMRDAAEMIREDRESH